MNYFWAGPTPPWRGGFAVPKEWSESGTPEGRWRKVVFGRVSQKCMVEQEKVPSKILKR